MNAKSKTVPVQIWDRARNYLGTWEKHHLIFNSLTIAMVIIFVGKSLESSLLGNLQLLTTSMATIGIVAAGQTLVIITGGIDLSVASVVGMTGMITAYLATIGIYPIGKFNPWLAAGIALLAATAVGWINGVLVSRYKLAPFIATFGMLNLLRGAVGLLSNGTPINLRSDVFDWMWTRIFGVVPVPSLILLLVFVIIAYLLKNSRYGRYAYVIGSNETVAHLSGVNIERTRQVIYATSGFLAGLSGLLLLSLIKGGAYQNGQYYELFSIAAVIIGGTSLRGGTGGVWGTLGGVLLMAMVKNGLILFSVPPLWNEMITGLVIIVAALVDIQRRRITEAAPLSRHQAAASPLVQDKPRSKTLDQALNRFAQALEDRFKYDSMNIYLHHRETEDLVKPDGERCPEGTLAFHVYQTGRAMTIADVHRDLVVTVNDLKPDTRVAAAVPILCDGKRLIGVAEFQSTAVNAFDPLELEAMVNVCSQLSGPIKDNWLLEIGWLTR